MKKKETTKTTVTKKTKLKEITPEPTIEKIDTVEEIIDLSYDDNTANQLESEGLGDLISKATSFLGFKECEPCKKRKLRFNKMFNWLHPKRMLTDEEHQLMNRISGTTTILSQDSKALFNLYNDVFGGKVERCSCSGLVKKMIERLNNWRYESIKDIYDENY